jgi:hypothetical protein
VPKTEIKVLLCVTTFNCHVGERVGTWYLCATTRYINVWIPGKLHKKCLKSNLTKKIVEKLKKQSFEEKCPDEKGVLRVKCLKNVPVNKYP